MSKRVTIHDLCGVAPATAAEHRLPLTYFDMLWLYFNPTQRLLFYPYPCSTKNFLENIVPSLKNSLSKTLAYYLPLTGNLILPHNSDKPEVRFCPGDSVQLAFAESSNEEDFNYNTLTGNQPRNADEFHCLVPDLPDPKSELGFDIIPLLAIQVTLFPETGISIGITNHHVVGDASSIVGFIKAWCSLAKFGENGKERDEESFQIPVYDRSLIEDPSGRADIFWNQMRALKTGSSFSKSPTIANRVRATFVLRKSEIQILKNLVSDRKPGLIHLSSYTVTTAYVWACLARSAEPSGENVHENEPDYFGIAVDARHRLEPPLPGAYFGNCLAIAVAETRHGVLKNEKDGFITAAEIIGDLIGNKVNNKDELLRDADEWLVKYGLLFGKRLCGVAGSPNFDLYDADFGWGKPDKYEAVSIDRGGSMSLCKSREFEGGLEIGLCLNREKMDAFQVIFSMKDFV